MENSKIYLSARKGGRCWNGFHRDGGSIIHAVPTRDGLEPNGFWGDKSLCGTEPGLRGFGWSKVALDVNCPKCLKKLEKWEANI